MNYYDLPHRHDLSRIIGSYTSIHALQEIHVRPGILKAVDPEAFCGLKTLRTLQVNDNHLCEAPAIETIKATLWELSLIQNAISQFPSDYFNGFSQLQIIRLTYNNLTYLPGLCRIEKSIKEISISDNQIQSLDAVLADGFYEVLWYIDVSYNIIHYLNISTLRNCPKLKQISVIGNLLTSIGDYRAYIGLISLTPYSNPWHCDSKLAWMSGLSSPILTCHSPECFSGKPVNEISEKWFPSFEWLLLEALFSNTLARAYTANMPINTLSNI